MVQSLRMLIVRAGDEPPSQLEQSLVMLAEDIEGAVLS
jgi:hypothetical protein